MTIMLRGLTTRMGTAALAIALLAMTAVGLGGARPAPAAAESLGVQYRAHVAYIGWQPWVADGMTAGTTGQSRAAEAFELTLRGAPVGVEVRCQAHVADIGWMSEVGSGQTCGTTGRSLPIQAVKLQLYTVSNGAVSRGAAGASIQYRCHLANIGWTDWVADGAQCGTTGQSRAMEALEVKVVVPPGRVTINYNNPGPISFGTPAVDYCVTEAKLGLIIWQNIRVENWGYGTLSGVTVSITGPDAADFRGPATLPDIGPLGASDMGMKFCPTGAPRTETATLTLTGNFQNSPLSIGLTGTGMPK